MLNSPYFEHVKSEFQEELVRNYYRIAAPSAHLLFYSSPSPRETEVTQCVGNHTPSTRGYR